ncbi:MAG: hypothetical protein LBN42_04105 [Oscillospiraceae bacterium]|jgi:hypothetical protein|nr:hypothetical protein [Oscillospiraceae bacterium]
MQEQVMKIRVVFDEGKVEREGKYDINKMYARIDKYFSEHNIPKIGKGFYQSTGKKGEYNAFAAFQMAYSEIDWFMDNLDIWTWYDGDYEEDFKEETLKAQKKYGRFLHNEPRLAL